MEHKELTKILELGTSKVTEDYFDVRRYAVDGAMMKACCGIAIVRCSF